MPPLMVSVWDAEARLSIAAGRADGFDEVCATLGLLKSLDLKGCIVTADALHCRPDTADALIAGKAHYALGLKASRGRLYACAAKSFAAADAAGDMAFHETREAAHGRSEVRRASILPLAMLNQAPAFPGLKAIGRIEATRTSTNGRTSTATRCVALSKLLSAKKLADTVRAHWTIENQLRWSLDVPPPFGLRSTRTTPARARITDRKTSPSCEGSPVTSWMPIPSTNPLQAKRAVQTAAKTSSVKSSLICNSPALKGGERRPSSDCLCRSTHPLERERHISASPARIVEK